MKQKLLSLFTSIALAGSINAQCTLGSYPTTYTTSVTGSNDRFIGNKYTLPTSATLTALGYRGWIAGNKVQMAIYTAGVGTSSVGVNLVVSTATAVTAIGNQTLSIGSPTVLPAGDYWILVNTNAAAATSSACACSALAYISSPFGTGVPSNPSPGWYASPVDDKLSVWAEFLSPTVTSTVSSASICAGTSATISASGASTYTWSTGSNATSIAVNPTATTNYTVTGSNGYCSATSTKSITVIAPPTITTLSSPSGSICAGQTVTITASGANTYTWISGVNTASYAVTPPVTSPYSVYGTSTLTGCTGSVSTLVFVSSAPTIGASATSGPYCSGNTYTLTASGASTYTWSTAAVSPTISVTPSASYPYTITGTGSNGCTGVLSQTFAITPTPTVTVGTSASVVCPGGSATLTAVGSSGVNFYGWSTGATGSVIVITPTVGALYVVTGSEPSGCNASANTIVNIGAVPNPSVVTNKPVLCAGSNATLTASGAATYTWNTGSSSNPFVINPTVSTTYTLTGASSAGCIKTVTITQNVTASPTVSAVSGSSLLCVGQTATLTASGAATYTWNTGSTTNPLAVSPTVTTTYTLTGANGSGCTNAVTITQNVSTCTGVNTLATNYNEFNVYPNPFNAKITVVVSNTNVQITIMDVLGKQLYKEVSTSTINEIDLSSYPQGIYFVKIGNDVKRIIKN